MSVLTLMAQPVFFSTTMTLQTLVLFQTSSIKHCNSQKDMSQCRKIKHWMTVRSLSVMCLTVQKQYKPVEIPGLNTDSPFHQPSGPESSVVCLGASQHAVQTVCLLLDLLEEVWRPEDPHTARGHCQSWLCKSPSLQSHLTLKAPTYFLCSVSVDCCRLVPVWQTCMQFRSFYY